MGNAEIKEQSAVAHMSEVCTVEMDLKLNCPLDNFKCISYFIHADSSKWCCCFCVLKKLMSLNSIG